MRLFVAIETPRDIRTSITALLAPFREQDAPIKWEQSEKLHVTLKFIGEATNNRLQAICQALSSSAGTIPAPFPVTYSAPGFFPNRSQPRIIWIGMNDPGRLTERLHNSIEENLQPLGIEREQKRFHPHITVGRVKGRIPPSLIEEMERLTLSTGQVKVDEFVLMRSELNAEGSRYALLERFPIGGTTA